VGAVRDVPVHPEVEPLAFLLGTWSGEGHGEYPNSKPFDYGEEIRVWHVGKPYLGYASRTWALDDGRPMHSELGYWRLKEGRVELAVTHPTGVVEIEDGELDGMQVRLATTAVAMTPTAKSVTRLERDLKCTGSLLTYELRMAAVDQPLQYHLSAQLTRA